MPTSLLKTVLRKRQLFASVSSLQSGEDFRLPADADLVLCADYCRQLDNGHEFRTWVTGLVVVPTSAKNDANMTEAVVEQYLKQKLEKPGFDCESEDSDEEVEDSDWLSIKRTRANILPDVPVKVKVYGGSGCRPVRSMAHCDRHGLFHISVRTNFEPTKVVARFRENPEISQSVRLTPVSMQGLSVISDVEDTIVDTDALRKTGTIADSRWRQLPGVCDWYRRMGCPTHYVSSCPWQFYGKMQEFLRESEMPIDSVTLTQYVRKPGKIIGMKTYGARDRKMCQIRKILEDFPTRDFVLIGSSWMNDLEIYASLAARYPDQIAGIYIRAVPGTFKSREETEILQAILDARETEDADSMYSATPTSSCLDLPAASSTSYGSGVNPEVKPESRKNSVPSQTSSFGSLKSNSHSSRLTKWVKRVDQVALRVPADIPIRFWWDPKDVSEECLGLRWENDP